MESKNIIADFFMDKSYFWMKMAFPGNIFDFILGCVGFKLNLFNQTKKFRGGLKTVFFYFLSKRGGGVSHNPKFSYQKKTEFFYHFFH